MHGILRSGVAIEAHTETISKLWILLQDANGTFPPLIMLYITSVNEMLNQSEDEAFLSWP